MDWMFLIFAGLMEIVWAIGLKETQGFTKFYPTLITLAAMMLSFYFLSIALKNIPIGTAYAVWVGIGAIGIALVGMIHFGESADILRLFCFALILIGIIGLKLLTP